MKIIIDIDEQWYYQIKKENSFKCGNTLYDTCIESVAKGTPLPKGHGRLIDADTLYREIETEGWFDSDDEYYGGGLEDIVLNAPTIIEADNIELDGVQLITIEEFEKIKEEIKSLPITDTAIRLISKTIDNHIYMKGENK